MTINKIILSYFSPTHTSEKIARAIAAGSGLTVSPRPLNATFEPVEVCTITDDELLIVSVPVYGGQVAPLALKRLAGLHGEGTPAVAVTLYGNRDFGHAPEQLAKWLTQRGFHVIGAAAFVGEHSFHTAEHPIAPGRPSAADLADAEAFGKALADKLRTSSNRPATVQAAELPHPKTHWLNKLRFIWFAFNYMRRSKRHPQKLVPSIDTTRCTDCGACAQVCPTGAIALTDLHTVNADKCIKCAACVKTCPQGARHLASPFAPVLAKNFHEPRANVTLL